MEFIDQSEFSRETRELEEGSDDFLFLWGIVIVMLFGLNVASWIFCIYVFGHPEVPFSYKILTRVDKLDPIKSFAAVTAPRGKFLAPRDIYALQYEFSPRKLNAYNRILKRNYLYNYKGLNEVPYVRGVFKVQSVRPLTSADVFPSGLAIRASAEDFPAAYIELIYPAESLPDNHYQPGDILDLDSERSDTCAALINIHRFGEENQDLCFTAVPVVGREYPTPAKTTIAYTPPEKLKLDAPFPITSDTPSIRAAPVDNPPIPEETGEKAGES